MRYLLLILKRSFLMTIILQLIFYINAWFITGNVDQSYFFVSKEHLFFSLKIWGSLFVLFLLIYSLGDNKY
jgi:hypothetical protein